ncbi:MAG: DUF167 domain-containing protein [Patescibacteria group bacterium]|jgi:hypothetical protein
MRIKVKVITRASRNAIEKLREGSFKVWVTVAPEKGKANQAVIELLALEFEVPRSLVRLTSGATSSEKVFEID